MSNRTAGTQGFFRKYLKFFAGLALVLLLGSLAVGAVLFYRYRTGPDSIFTNLRAALIEGDKAGLAAIMDFRSLSEDIALAVLAADPQNTAHAHRKAEMQDEAQRLVLKALTDGKNTKTEPVLPRKLFERVPFMPTDVVPQFAAGMTLEKTADGAQIHARFTHHGLQKDFPVRLLMERRQGDWRVTRLLNAQELVRLYQGAMDALLAEDEAKLVEKNEKISERMRAHFASPQCLASAHLMGSKREAMLVIKVTAHNKDTTTLHNVNLLIDVRAGSGSSVYSRQLDVVQRVFGGGEFSNTWTIVLDADSDDAARLLQAGPLSCTVTPKVMSVGAGEILYPRTD